MLDLTQQILELIRLTSTDLPPDVENAIHQALDREQPGSAARGALETILKNVELSRQNSTPICQDTGTPIFYIHYPTGWSTRELRSQIEAAVVEATRKAYLRPNSVDSLTGKNSGNNLAAATFPPPLREVEGDTLTIQLMLKGGRVVRMSASNIPCPTHNLVRACDLVGCAKSY
jgi:fumarate hydratase class I